jgi:hypothetical protein
MFAPRREQIPDTPTFNPTRSVFGERNDRAPNHAYLSHGLVSVSYERRRRWRGPFVARAPSREESAFQNTPNTTLISGASTTPVGERAATGSRAGPLAPTPDWGTRERSFQRASQHRRACSPACPNVTFFAKDYAAPRSLRSIQLEWPALNNLFTGNIERPIRAT